MSAYASPFTLPTASFSPASSRFPSAPVVTLKRPGPVGLPAATDTIRRSSSLSWWETPTTSSRPSPLTSPALSSNHRWVEYGVRVAEAAAPARVNGPARTWRSSCTNVARSLDPSPLKSPAVSSLPTSPYGVPTRSVAPPESPALPPHTTVSDPASTPSTVLTRRADHQVGVSVLVEVGGDERAAEPVPGLRDIGDTGRVLGEDLLGGGIQASARPVDHSGESGPGETVDRRPGRRERQIAVPVTVEVVLRPGGAVVARTGPDGTVAWATCGRPTTADATVMARTRRVPKVRAATRDS